MSLITDTKYLLLISSHLEGFHQVDSTTWQCRCPICGDSEKKKNKMRGYFYPSTDKNSLLYKCHNCGESKSLSYMIKKFSKEHYQSYLYDRLLGRSISCGSLRSNQQEKPKQEKVTSVALDPENNLLARLDFLPENHQAIQYVKSRLIPKKAFKKLYWTTSFKQLANKFIPDKFSAESLNNDYPAIVIPLFDRTGNKMFGFQGRSIQNDPKIPRYITILLDRDQRRLFGLDTVDESKKFYVVEGPIDSLFLENSVAVCGSDMLDIENENAVFILDCEPRNAQIVTKLEKLIKENRKVCILPSEKFSGMDINDLVLSGYTQEEIQDLIDMHTYQGLGAFIKFQAWKRTNNKNKTTEKL